MPDPSKADKMTHPQACVLSDALWDQFFDQELSDLCIHAMKISSLAELEFYLSINSTQFFSDERLSIQIWICIALSHPHFTVDELMDLAMNRLFITSQVKMVKMASAVGRIDILTQFKWKKMPDNTENKCINACLISAANNGHIDILHWMKAWITEHDVSEHRLDSLGISFLDKLALFIGNGHHEIMIGDALYDVILRDLLSLPTVFAHAEAHDREYGALYVYPFVQDKLADLHQKQQLWMIDHPNEAFNITDPREAKLCFYILRNMIRRHDRALDNDLNFLLNIPSVKALAHTEVTPGVSNELLCLALSNDNDAARDTLLNIPEVYQLAQQNQFYQVQHDRNIPNLYGPESSMAALTPSEQKRLQNAITAYTPSIKEKGGVKNVLTDLKTQLVKRYHDNPARITTHQGEEITLPVEWDAFQALHLRGEDYQLALKAYYQNTDHTALRFLSVPNHWISNKASFVEIDPHHHTMRGAIFDGYQDLIAMLWLAAKDEKIAPTEGHTLEGRIDNFIKELALIGRAHNWDKKRIKRDPQGNIVYKNNGKAKKEAYDDLEGDKPSCFSGMKSRLFQSVIGHPLLGILTEEMLNQELRNFVQEQFKKKINKQNGRELYQAYIDSSYELNKTKAAPLKALNISTSDQTVLIQYLKEKYGNQLDVFLQVRIKQRFTQTVNHEKNDENLENYHALKFGNLVDLRDLLQPYALVVPPIAEEKSNTKTNMNSLIEQGKCAESQSEAKTDMKPLIENHKKNSRHHHKKHMISLFSHQKDKRKGPALEKEDLEDLPKKVREKVVAQKNVKMD